MINKTSNIPNQILCPFCPASLPLEDPLVLQSRHDNQHQHNNVHIVFYAFPDRFDDTLESLSLKFLYNQKEFNFDFEFDYNKNPTEAFLFEVKYKTDYYLIKKFPFHPNINPNNIYDKLKTILIFS